MTAMTSPRKGDFSAPLGSYGTTLHVLSVIEMLSRGTSLYSVLHVSFIVKQFKYYTHTYIYIYLPKLYKRCLIYMNVVFHVFSYDSLDEMFLNLESCFSQH